MDHRRIESFISKSGGFPPNNPGGRLKEAIKHRDFKLIVIDPRATESAKRALSSCNPCPARISDSGCNAQRYHSRQLYDADFIAANVAGFEALKRAVTPFTPDYVAQRADVPAANLSKLRGLFAGARYAGIGVAWGPASQ